jgi:energy-coupling factor transporter transmembrane protein EcfT
MVSIPSDFSSSVMGCAASICSPNHFDGFTVWGLLVALVIFCLLIFRKKISLKKYLIIQVILFLVFSSTFLTNGVSFGCCNSPTEPKREISKIWSVLPDQFVPIYVLRISWFLDFLDIVD